MIDAIARGGEYRRVVLPRRTRVGGAQMQEVRTGSAAHRELQAAELAGVDALALEAACDLNEPTIPLQRHSSRQTQGGATSENLEIGAGVGHAAHDPVAEHAPAAGHDVGIGEVVEEISHTRSVAPRRTNGGFGRSEEALSMAITLARGVIFATRP